MIIPNRDMIDSTLGLYEIDLYQHQRRPLFDPHPVIVVVGGERSGKSYGVSAFLLTRIPFGRLFWIVGPDYNRCRKEFTNVVDWIESRGGIIRKQCPDEGPWTAVLKGGIRLETKSTEDVSKLAAESVDGILLVEFAKTSKDALNRCVGRVSDSEGWVLASGIFEEGEGWAEEVYEEYEREGSAYKWPTWLNVRRFPGGFSYECAHQIGKCTCNPRLVLQWKKYGPRTFRKRIGAERVRDEVLVYDCWTRGLVDTNPVVDPRHCNQLELRVAGVDYGFGDPTVIEVYGLRLPTWYGLDEFYATHVTALRLRPVLDGMRRAWGISTFFIPHDKPEIAVEYEQLCDIEHVPDQERCVFVQSPASWGVQRGISYVYSLKETGRVRYCEEQEYLIREQSLYTYHNRESRNKGEKPVDLNNHCCDAERKVLVGMSAYYDEEFMRLEQERMESEQRRINPRAAKFLHPAGAWVNPHAESEEW